jgi:hypothetical protein
MKTFFGILFLLFSHQSNSQDCLQLKGQWVNELGSALIIEDVGPDGKIIGQYASSTGVDGKVFPLTGWMNRSEENPEEINIAFMVRWTGYGSITSWTGYCVEDEDGIRIKTIWNLVRSGKEHDWERIITNSSTFTLK